jgi:hypothetical protein
VSVLRVTGQSYEGKIFAIENRYMPFKNEELSQKKIEKMTETKKSRSLMLHSLNFAQHDISTQDGISVGNKGNFFALFLSANRSVFC